MPHKHQRDIYESLGFFFTFITHYFLTLFIMAFCDFNELNNEERDEDGDEDEVLNKSE